MAQLEPILADLLDRTPEKDRYLVSVYLSANADLLVTTDIPLHDSLSQSDVRCRMRDEFLANYLR